MKKTRSEHRRALEILAIHPEYIGISKKDVLTSSIEQILFYKGNFYTEIDLVYELTSGKLIIVEYKSNGHKKLMKKGKNQLNRGIDFYQKIKKITSEGRLITGDSLPILKSKIYSKKKLFNNYSLRKK